MEPAFSESAGEGVDMEIEVRQLFEMEDFEKNERRPVPKNGS